ncbi:ABC transporter substrate binding protein [Variovorax sp. RT4R15]|uniref:ABC transporter substrate binding protein n=1 Tax=Variovorax sp. RT4R15 TaxID=3443737 RepID=UPI003F445EA4
MSHNPFKPSVRGLWPTFCLALAGLCTSAGLAQAMSVTVLQADDLPAHAEFVRQLRDTQEPGSRFALLRVTAGSASAIAAAGEAGAGTEEDRANASVRTRSIRPSSAVDAITVAVGAGAARVAIDRPGNDPLVLAMLSRLDYESLKANPALRRAERRVGVLLRDPAMADQLALVDAVLPRKRRLGVVATNESEPLLRELQRAAQGWELQVEYAPDARSLAAALKTVLAKSDALMVLPDLIGDDQAATLAVLRAAATAGVPVFGASDGLVRSGGLAAAVSTPALLAKQARTLGQKVAAGAPGAAPLVEAATPATVRVNVTVARALGLRVADERELTERVTVAR